MPTTQRVWVIDVCLDASDGGLTATVKDTGRRLRSAPVIPEDVPLTRRRGTAVRMTKRLRAG